MARKRLTAAAAILLAVAAAFGQEAPRTERLYLSGRGPSDAVTWDFRISAGRGAGAWSTIPVPQQWEQAGFGSYAYGFDESSSDEVGEYRTSFEVPATWSGRRLTLVFEGAMTDVEVRVNGESVGPPHQGGFTPFGYDIGRQVRFDGPNLLEVTVAERSTNRSVNEAERQADYWVFGGIYRPVVLEARPAAAILGVAIDARHDGTLRVELETATAAAGARARLRVLSREGREVGSLEGSVSGERALLSGRVPDIEPWSADRPQLYDLELSLERDGAILHRVVERFGFRTFVIDPRRGLLVNGRSVRLKGINRHSFWPETGRALDPEVNRRDALLIKELNANAVRTSHYPPDVAFLEACDEIGLYVLDELPGWHDAYDTEVGTRLVREMVRRDRNHPSVVMWSNGNEGGWNTALDREFARHDPQRRPVLHPDEVFGGLDTKHYLTWRDLTDRLDPNGTDNKIRRFLRQPLPWVLPTELLHGLWDGGHGAGLAGFWDLIRESPRGAGLFLWAFLDETLARTDTGLLDTAANFAPDGIVGPYREKEGSFEAVRRIWSPVVVATSDIADADRPRVALQNRFDHLSLDEIGLEWSWLTLPAIGQQDTRVLAAGSYALPEARPGSMAGMELPAAPLGEPPHALRLEAFEPSGRSLQAWVLPVRGAWPATPAQLQDPRPVTVTDEGGRGFVLASGDIRVRIEATGGLRTLTRGSRSLHLGGGPRPVPQRGITVTETTLEIEGGGVELRYGQDQFVRWQLQEDGWLRLDYRFWPRGRSELAGISFDVDETSVSGARWLGRGPGRVWANRTETGPLGVWTKAHNDTSTGQDWDYPEFRGFHAGVRWLELDTEEGRLLLVPGDEDGFVGLFPPAFATGMAPDGETMARGARAEVAPGLSVLQRISAIGTKFKSADELAPDDLRRPPRRPIAGHLWLGLASPEGGSS